MTQSSKYRKEVERRAEAGQFSWAARRLLDTLRLELGVSEADTQAIEAEVLKPYQEYQRKQQEYQDTLQQCLQDKASLNPRTIKDLMDFRAHLRLTLEDVAAVDQELLGFSLENYKSEIERRQQEKEKADYENKLQQYQESFIRSVQAGYPLNQYVSDGLKAFQQQLGLSEEEVARIEQPIRKPAEANYQQESRKREEAERQRREAAEARRKQEESAKTERKRSRTRSKTARIREN